MTTNHDSTHPSTKQSTQGALGAAREWLASPARAFENDADLLRRMKLFYEVAGLALDAADDPDPGGVKEAFPALRARIHECLRLPAKQGLILGCIQRNELDELESEMLVLVILSSLGARIFNQVGADIDDLTQISTEVGSDLLAVAQVFQPQGRLRTAGLIVIDEEDLWVASRVRLSDRLQDALFRPLGETPWRLDDYEEFLEHLSEVCGLMISIVKNDADDESKSRKSREPEMPRRLARLLAMVRTTLAEHPDWPLYPVAPSLSDAEFAILLALMAKDLGHLPCGSELFTGKGLAAAVGYTGADTLGAMRLFSEGATLRDRGWIRPLAYTGIGGMLMSSESTLAHASWELTIDARNEFDVPLHRRLEEGGMRKTTIRLDDLVLHQETLDSLLMAIGQARDPEGLLVDWGLGRVIGYGLGTTMLFSGPSGVGKTAAAEAVATELDRPLIEADCSRLLSCWVGETEKNLARLFREAAQMGAVLFFDEADAFFYDRSTADKGWEISKINLLLRELERFEGVCILATNRKDCFDPAFERRLTLRLEFQRPDAAMSAKIWRRLVPPELPCDGFIDFEKLGSLCLTGGQVKNAVLNAARRAYVSAHKRVSMADLLRAAEAERPGMAGSIGFRGTEAAPPPLQKPTRERAA